MVTVNLCLSLPPSTLNKMCRQSQGTVPSVYMEQTQVQTGFENIRSSDMMVGVLFTAGGVLSNTLRERKQKDLIYRATVDKKENLGENKILFVETYLKASCSSS